MAMPSTLKPPSWKLPALMQRGHVNPNLKILPTRRSREFNGRRRAFPIAIVLSVNRVYATKHNAKIHCPRNAVWA